MKTRYRNSCELCTDLVRRPKHTWCPGKAPSSPRWRKPRGLHSKVPSAIASLSLGPAPSCFPAKAGLPWEHELSQYLTTSFISLESSVLPDSAKGVAPLCQASQSVGPGNHTGHIPNLRTRAACPVTCQMAQRMVRRCGLDPLTNMETSCKF